jgi:hypothetical protein
LEQQWIFFRIGAMLEIRHRSALLASSTLPLLLAACALDPSGAIDVSQTSSGGNAGGSGATTSNTGGTGTAGGGAGAAGGGPQTCASGDECLPAIPGWSEVWVIEADFLGANAAPKCPGGADAARYLSGPAGAPQCGDCGCDFSGVRCTTPGLACKSGSDCNMAPAVFKTTPETCTPFTDPIASGRCKWDQDPQIDPATTGTCTGNASAIMDPAPWSKHAYVCPIPATGTCANGGTCASPASEEFAAARICVESTTPDACPTGYTALEIDAYESGLDTRSCGSCQCDLTNATCTGGSVIVADRDQCTSDGGSATLNDATCTSINFFDGTAFAVATRGTPANLACAQPTGTGQVSPMELHKLCCR